MIHKSGEFTYSITTLNSENINIELKYENGLLSFNIDIPLVKILSENEELFKQIKILKQEITNKDIDHVANIMKLLVRENITLENLSIKKDRLNKIVATYRKHKPLTEDKHKEVIKGVLKGLYKK